MSDILINVVLDKSGSMGHLAQTVRDGYNAFMDDQRKLPGAVVSLTFFDTIARQEHVGLPIDSLPPLDASNYQPGGGTALYDAIMQSIALTKKMPGRPPKVLFLIITDGQENSSQKYGWKEVSKALATQTKAGWEFIYLSSDPDAWEHSAKIGVANAGTYGYGAGPVGTQAMFASVSNSTRMTRSGMTDTVAKGMATQATGDNATIDPTLVAQVTAQLNATPPVATAERKRARKHRV